jgi:hypothetical protein
MLPSILLKIPEVLHEKEFQDPYNSKSEGSDLTTAVQAETQTLQELHLSLYLH